MPIPDEGQLSRDAHGTLSFSSQGKATAYKAGEGCTIVVQQMAFLAECSGGKTEMKMEEPGLSSLTWDEDGNKNYFNLIDNKSGVPSKFYSIAPIENGHGSFVVTTGLDGSTWAFGGKFAPFLLTRDWGSDLISAGSICGNTSVLIATGTGDYTQPDRIQAFTVTDRAEPASVPLALPGPVTALFGSPARVVVRNLKTGNYEAYEIALSCNH
jgi:hypothetical protein